MHIFASHANYDIEMSYIISLFHCVIWAVITTADLSVFLLGPAQCAAVPPCREVIIQLRADHGSGNGVHTYHARMWLLLSWPISSSKSLLVSCCHNWFKFSSTLLIWELFGDPSNRHSSSPAAHLHLIENVHRVLTQEESPGEQSPLFPMSWPHRRGWKCFAWGRSIFNCLLQPLVKSKPEVKGHLLTTDPGSCLNRGFLHFGYH